MAKAKDKGALRRAVDHPMSERLRTAPLPALLAESRAEIVDSDVHAPGYGGFYVRLRDGRLLLSVPKRLDREATARHLLGCALRTRVEEVSV